MEHVARPLSLISYILLCLVACCGATSNLYYFSFPIKSDFVPQVHVGDVLNISWVDSFPGGSLFHWCGTKILERNDAQSTSGSKTFTVNETWNGPCHWQFADGSAGEQYIDSGFVDIIKDSATSKTEWGPMSSNFTCTTASTSTASDTPTQSDGAKCTAKHGGRPGFGAGIGVGLVIGVAICAITAVIWTLVSRKRTAKRTPDVRGYHNNQYSEFPNASRPVELAANTEVLEMPSKVN